MFQAGWGRSDKLQKEQISPNHVQIKYLDVGPQTQLPPPYAEDINALLTMS